MVQVKRGKHGDNLRDEVRVHLILYSQLRGHPVRHIADAACSCGARAFHLILEDSIGLAVLVCVCCGSEQTIGDHASHCADAEPEECECPCGGDAFEITVGVSLYQEDSEIVSWLYLGCRCTYCGFSACWDDWPIEVKGCQELLVPG
jgi:hypothetical protein